MNRINNHAATLAVLVGLSASSVYGQNDAPQAASNAPRLQVQMDLAEFKKTHRWDEQSDMWVLKSGVEPPTGLKSRVEVKAERDAFLRTHRWREPTGWEPLEQGPRDLSTLTRQQVKAETVAFMRTHRWDEEKEAWVEKAPRYPKK